MVRWWAAMVDVPNGSISLVLGSLQTTKCLLDLGTVQHVNQKVDQFDQQWLDVITALLSGSISHKFASGCLYCDAHPSKGALWWVGTAVLDQKFPSVLCSELTKIFLI